MFEQLENRRHLSVTAADIHDTLHVWGDANNNGISVEKSGSNLVVKEYKGSGVGYQPIFTVLASAVHTVRVYGYDGIDTVTINDNVTHKTVVQGGRGADWIKGGGGETTVYGHGNWADDPSGSHKPTTDDNAADTLVSGAGYAIMHGQGGNDSFFTTFGGAGATTQYDALFGGNGNDTFNLTGRRQAFVFGDAGGDTFKIYSQNQRANLYGGTGTDTVDYANFGVAVHAEINKPSGPLAAYNDRRQLITPDVETIKGTPFNDKLVGDGANQNLFGQAGHDLIYGNGGNDLVDGGEGNDTLYGNAGNDTIFGQNGNDKIRGGDNNDYLFGHAGNDSLYGENGNDYMMGGANNDLMYGDAGNDSLYGESGTDWLYAGSGANKLVGGAESDYLYAKNGGLSDLIFGDNENGTGGYGSFDIAVIDRVWIAGIFHYDFRTGVESVSY